MNDFDTSTNERDLGKLIVSNGFKKLPQVQKIAQSGHTGFIAVYLSLNRTKLLCLNLKVKKMVTFYLRFASLMHYMDNLIINTFR